MEPEGSLPSSQGPATGPYPDPHLPPYFFKIHSNIIPPSTPRSCGWSLPFRLSDQNVV